MNLHVQTSMNLTKPVEKKQKKKKKAYWGESSSDEDYASSSSHGGGPGGSPKSGNSGTTTPDYGSGSDDDVNEQKYNDKGKAGAKVEVDDEGYESPPSSMFGKAFSAAGNFLSSLPASAQKLRQRALGPTPTAVAPAAVRATMGKKIDEITKSWKTAGGSARANLAAQMAAAGSSMPSDKPVESDPFSAQPVGAEAASSAADNSRSSSSNQLALRSLKPLDPVEEAVREKNLASEKKLADLAAEERALKETYAKFEKELRDAQSDLAKTTNTKAESSHARTAELFSAHTQVGAKATQLEETASTLARVQERQKDEKRKIEARELDPGIETDVETDAESRSAAAADVIGRWHEFIQESEPYKKADYVINNMSIDARQKMMTINEYMDMMNPYDNEFTEFLKDEATKLKRRGNTPLSSITLAEKYWDNHMEHGWKNYQFKYAMESRILERARELEQRYFEERKTDREERKKEQEAKLQRKRLRELEQETSRGMIHEMVSDAETLSEPESGPDDEPNFVKEAAEEVVEEEAQDHLFMNPAIPTITSRELGQIPDALNLATLSQTLSKELKLNPANAILVLKRLDAILATDSQKLAKKGLTRMPGFSVQVTGKIVKTGKKSSYASMKAVIVKRISELEKKQQASSKASSSSSSSSRSSGRAK